MQRRSGLGVSGKAGHTARRNIIMTFLANCAIEEIETFMHLIMDPFKSLLDGKLVRSLTSYLLLSQLFNTYSMKQPDLYYFETIKMTSQAKANFVWRIRAAGEYSLWTLIRFVTSFFWFQNSIDQAVS